MGARTSKPSAAERRAKERAEKLKRDLAAAKRELAKLAKEVAAAKVRAEEAKKKHAAELEEARARTPSPAAPPAEIAALPPPPADPLAAQAYAHQLLMISLYDAARDEKISPRERRKELRTIAASAAKLLPRSRIHKAEQLVLNQVADLEKKQRDRRGAKLEKLPKPAPPATAPASSEAHGEEPRQ